MAKSSIPRFDDGEEPIIPWTKRSGPPPVVFPGDAAASTAKKTSNPTAPMSMDHMLASLSMLRGLAGSYGQYQQGKAQGFIAEGNARTGEISAAMAREMTGFNKKISGIQLEGVKKAGQSAESSYRSKVKLVAGSQRAKLAAQGININEGSAYEVQSDTHNIGEQDALTIRNNALRQAFGIEIQGDLAEMQGQQAAAGLELRAEGSRLGGRLAEQSSRSNALDTLVTGGLSALMFLRG